MARSEHRDLAPEVGAASQLPAGTPAWITPELVALTLRVWQPFYESPLTPADAVAMIENVGRLFGVLSQVPCRETVRRPRASQQP
jgi:hypothetical protein